jgi:hypothetical protein
MAAVKRLNTTYTLDTSEVIITGNLTVRGAQTSLETTNSTLKDNIIVLNDGETGAGVTLGTSGILIDRGSSTDVALRWTEANGGSWQVTSDGTNYANILTGTGGAGITAVVEDTSPDLGGNLTTNGFHLQFDTPTINPPTPSGGPVIGKTLLYGANVGSAGSGLFVINTGTTSDELVTKSKAIVFSIIL